MSVRVNRVLFAGDVSFVDTGSSGRLLDCEGVVSCAKPPPAGEGPLRPGGSSTSRISEYSNFLALDMHTLSPARNSVQPLLSRCLGQVEMRAAGPWLGNSSRHDDKCAVVKKKDVLCLDIQAGRHGLL